MKNREAYARVALVTGATSGIGEATVRRFVAAGFGVTGTGRNAAKLGQLEAELGKSFKGVAGDMAAAETVERLFAATAERFGKAPDIVVANAGRGLGGSVKDADLSRFEGILRVNVTGTLALLQRAAREMLPRQERGYPDTAADIVVVGSVVGRHISPFSAVYGATKFAAHALAEGLRRELGPKGVRVTLVEPGITVSGFQDAAGYSDAMVQNFEDKFGPLLVAEDVADTIQYVVSLPPRVHVSDIMVRPTRQDYP
ncbi:MAG: SDR family oxidoreductase [Kiritimatiellae bacterium]|nr:SDR family oxidoreductase [Kiritimatiellia bacterium]